MRALILTTNYSYQVTKMLDGMDLSAHEINIHWAGKAQYDKMPDYDVGVSFMYQHRVPKEQLTKPWFNFHPAPLPKYRGRNLCYWAIVNGETDFGATLHYMDENFDTGDIIEVSKIHIQDWWTAQDLSEYTINVSKSMFMHYFPRIIAGEKFERLPNVGGVYFKKQLIPEFLEIGDERCEYFLKNEIRAITYGNFYPKIDIGGKTYKIVRDE